MGIANPLQALRMYYMNKHSSLNAAHARHSYGMHAGLHSED